MSTESNKTALRRFFDAINNKNMATLEEFIAPNQVDHGAPAGMPAGAEGAKQLFAMYFTAFPDLHFTVEDMVAEDDRVATRFTISGTQQGAFMGIPATGKHVKITATEINRLAGGQSVEHWMDIDALGLMQQLGVVPV